MHDFDVIVAGAGIAGASLAWRLAERARVLLLERAAHDASGWAVTTRDGERRRW